MSDRAQSIQSLHSTVETPTPDNTPSYEELQQRLESSNRNIQSMQEQQQQLLRLQNAAKQHLSEMEQLRQNAGKLSFNPNAGAGGEPQANGGGAPDYESIGQIQNEMALLVGRMKNLTQFIQNQNELSDLLGDDGPEILAEQEALQAKLESLRTQRDEMRNLVQELQDINKQTGNSHQRRVSADDEESVSEKQDEEERETTPVQMKREQPPKKATNVERVVPVEYSRMVPIELLTKSSTMNGNNAGNSEDEEEEADPATAALIKQKVADIEAMKLQLKRLKDMMETVSLIEERTEGPAVKDIGRQSAAASSSYDRESTPIAVPIQRSPLPLSHDELQDPNIARKVRMINEVTTDLRQQAASLTAERDRIKALRDEIIRRKEQAAAAAQMGEDALARHSLTPTPTPLQRLQRETNESLEERDRLKEEYETKKREFEIICKRLQSEDETDEKTSSTKASTKTTTATASAVSTAAANRQRQQRADNAVSEADDEADEELNDSDFGSASAATTAKYYGTSMRGSKSTIAANSGQSSSAEQQPNKSSLNTTLNSSLDEPSSRCNKKATTSLDATSMKSGSSRSSMPPAMPAMHSTENWGKLSE